MREVQTNPGSGEREGGSERDRKTEQQTDRERGRVGGGRKNS